MEHDSESRKLAAILSADVWGYSRLMESDEDDAFKRLKTSRELVFRKIDEHQGRVANTAGDAVLAEFNSVRGAILAATEIQKAIAELNDGAPEDRRMWFRIGINLGDVIERGGDLFGDGVNIAARLQSLAEPGGICLSQSVHEQSRRNHETRFAYVGEQSVKNIAEPIKVYKVVTGLAAVSKAEPASAGKARLAGPGEFVVAVLPFDNLSDDPSQTYFSDGLTDDLIAGLATIESLRVPARNTMYTFKGKAVNIPKLAEELGATHIVEGSVRKSGDRLRINVQLSDAANGRHVWARRFDKAMSDLFDIQDEIVQGVVIELDVRLAHGEQAREWRRCTRNPEAYDLFWQAADIHYRNAVPTRENLERSRSLVDRALRIDPAFVSAYEQKAWGLLLSILFGYQEPQAAAAEALAAVEQALRVDNEAAAAHGMRGYLHLLFTDDEQTAAQEIERGLYLNPLLPDTNYYAANLWARREDFDRMLLHARRARDLWRGPATTWLVSVEIHSLLGLRRLDEAREVLGPYMGQGEGYMLLWFLGAIVNAALGRNEEARRIYLALMERWPGFSPETNLRRYEAICPKQGRWYADLIKAAGLA